MKEIPKNLLPPSLLGASAMPDGEADVATSAEAQVGAGPLVDTEVSGEETGAGILDAIGGDVFARDEGSISASPVAVVDVLAESVTTTTAPRSLLGRAAAAVRGVAAAVTGVPARLSNSLTVRAQSTSRSNLDRDWQEIRRVYARSYITVDGRDAMILSLVHGAVTGGAVAAESEVSGYALMTYFGEGKFSLRVVPTRDFDDATCMGLLIRVMKTTADAEKIEQALAKALPAISASPNLVGEWQGGFLRFEDPRCGEILLNPFYFVQQSHLQNPARWAGTSLLPVATWGNSLVKITDEARTEATFGLAVERAHQDRNGILILRPKQVAEVQYQGAAACTTLDGFMVVDQSGSGFKIGFASADQSAAMQADAAVAPKLTLVSCRIEDNIPELPFAFPVTRVASAIHPQIGPVRLLLSDDDRVIVCFADAERATRMLCKEEPGGKRAEKITATPWSLAWMKGLTNDVPGALDFFGVRVVYRCGLDSSAEKCPLLFIVDDNSGDIVFRTLDLEVDAAFITAIEAALQRADRRIERNAAFQAYSKGMFLPVAPLQNPFGGTLGDFRFHMTGRGLSVTAASELGIGNVIAPDAVNTRRSENAHSDVGARRDASSGLMGRLGQAWEQASNPKTSHREEWQRLQTKYPERFFDLDGRPALLVPISGGEARIRSWEADVKDIDAFAVITDENESFTLRLISPRIIVEDALLGRSLFKAMKSGEAGALRRHWMSARLAARWENHPGWAATESTFNFISFTVPGLGPVPFNLLAFKQAETATKDEDANPEILTLADQVRYAMAFRFDRAGSSINPRFHSAQVVVLQPGAGGVTFQPQRAFRTWNYLVVQVFDGFILLDQSQKVMRYAIVEGENGGETFQRSVVEGNPDIAKLRDGWHELPFQSEFEDAGFVAGGGRCVDWIDNQLGVIRVILSDGDVATVTLYHPARAQLRLSIDPAFLGKPFPKESSRYSRDWFRRLPESDIGFVHAGKNGFYAAHFPMRRGEFFVLMRPRRKTKSLGFMVLQRETHPEMFLAVRKALLQKDHRITETRVNFLFDQIVDGDALDHIELLCSPAGYKKYPEVAAGEKERVLHLSIVNGELTAMRADASGSEVYVHDPVAGVILLDSEFPAAPISAETVPTIAELVPIPTQPITADYIRSLKPGDHPNFRILRGEPCFMMVSENLGPAGELVLGIFTVEGTELAVGFAQIYPNSILRQLEQGVPIQSSTGQRFDGQAILRTSRELLRVLHYFTTNPSAFSKGDRTEIADTVIRQFFRKMPGRNPLVFPVGQNRIDQVLEDGPSSTIISGRRVIIESAVPSSYLRAPVESPITSEWLGRLERGAPGFMPLTVGAAARGTRELLAPPVETRLLLLESPSGKTLMLARDAESLCLFSERDSSSREALAAVRSQLGAAIGPFPPAKAKAIQDTLTRSVDARLPGDGSVDEVFAEADGVRHGYQIFGKHVVVAVYDKEDPNLAVSREAFTIVGASRFPVVSEAGTSSSHVRMRRDAPALLPPPPAGPTRPAIRAGMRDVSFKRVEYPHLAGKFIVGNCLFYENDVFGICINYYPERTDLPGGPIGQISLYHKMAVAETVLNMRYFLGHRVGKNVAQTPQGSQFTATGQYAGIIDTEVVAAIRSMSGEGIPEELRVDFNVDFPTSLPLLPYAEVREPGEVYDEEDFRALTIDYVGTENVKKRNGQKKFSYNYTATYAGGRKHTTPFAIIVDPEGKPVRFQIDVLLPVPNMPHTIAGTIVPGPPGENDTWVLSADVTGDRVIIIVERRWLKSAPERAVCLGTKVLILTAKPRRPAPRILKSSLNELASPPLAKDADLSFTGWKFLESPVYDLGVALQSRSDGEACCAIAFPLTRGPFKTLRELIDAASEVFWLTPDKVDTVAAAATTDMEIVSKMSSGGSKLLITTHGSLQNTYIHSADTRPAKAALSNLLTDHPPETYGRCDVTALQPHTGEAKFPSDYTGLAAFQGEEDTLIAVMAHRSGEMFLVPEKQIAALVANPADWRLAWGDPTAPAVRELEVDALWRGHRVAISAKHQVAVMRKIINADLAAESRFLAAREKLQAKVADINARVARLPRTEMAVDWPKVLVAGQWSSVTAPRNDLSVRVMNGAVNQWREIFSGQPFRAGRSVPVELRFGDGGEMSAYDLVTRDDAGAVVVELVPRTATGAPAGVIQCITHNGVVVALRIAPDSELHRHMVGALFSLDVVWTYEDQRLTVHSPTAGRAAFVMQLLNQGWEVAHAGEKVAGIQNEDANTSRLTIPASLDGISQIWLLLESYSRALDQLRRPRLVAAINPWRRRIDQYLIQQRCVEAAGKGHIEFSVTRTRDSEGTTYRLDAATIRGQSSDKLAAGSLSINGNVTKQVPTELHEGDHIAIRHDTPLGYEDIATIFRGESLEIVPGTETYITAESQVVYRTGRDALPESMLRTADGNIVPDSAFILDVELYSDYRAAGEIKPIRHRRVDLKSGSWATVLGFDVRAKVQCLSAPDDWAIGGELAFDIVGYGVVTFEARFRAGQLHLTRHADVTDALQVTSKPGRMTLSHRGQRAELTVERIGGGKGARPFDRIVEVDVAKVLALASLVGEPIKLRAGEVLAVEPTENSTEAEGEKSTSDENSGGDDDPAQREGLRVGPVRLVPTRRNRDGTRPIRSLYLRRPEYLVIREALDGIGARMAEGPEVQEFAVPTPDHSVLSALQIAPGEAFLPTEDTLKWIQNTFAGALDFPDGHVFTERLEFEADGGLTISVPVRWKNRLHNPFEIDADGVFDPVTGEVVAGRRIETYMKGQPHTRRAVDQALIEHEQGGNWRLYAMMSDPLTGVHKAFNLATVHGAGIEDPTPAEVRAAKQAGQKPPPPRWLVTPLIFGLVNLTELPKAITETDADLQRNEKDYRIQGRARVNQRILQVYGTSQPASLPGGVRRMSQVRAEKVGDITRLVFASASTPDGDPSTDPIYELSGLELDRQSKRLDFAEVLTLSEYTWVSVIDADGVVSQERRLVHEAKFEHALGERRGMVRLTEIVVNGKPRIFEWDLLTGTLTEVLVPVPIEDTQVAREGRLTLEQLRNLNLPVIDIKHWKTSSEAHEDAVGERPAAQLDIKTDFPLPEASLEDSGVLLPAADLIENVTDAKRAHEILAQLELHGMIGMPDVASVLTALGGRHREPYVITFPDGSMLVIPVTERNEHPYDYLPETSADPVRGAGGAALTQSPKENDPITLRFLAANPDLLKAQDAPALKSSSYLSSTEKKTRLLLCPHQHEAMQPIEEWLEDALTSDDQKTATVAMPTGAGKTYVAGATLELLEMHGAWREGDKVFIYANQEDLIDQLEGEFKGFFPGKKVTRVQAGTVDFSGDIVVLSIQTITGRGFDLEKQVRESLKKGAKIALNVFDEWHHGDADTWQDVVNVVGRVNQSPVLGLTATPVRGDPNIIVNINIRALMNNKASPNGRLVEIDGATLRDLKKPSDIDSNSDLMGIIRNKNIMRGIERHAVRRACDPRSLATMQVTANSVAHAVKMALAYQEYFSDGVDKAQAYREHLIRQRPLLARRIAVMGDGREHGDVVTDITAMRALIEERKAGRIDAIVAVASSKLTPEARKFIFENWKAGLIEAVFTAGIWLEGADLKFVRNFVDAQATMSEQLESQKKGRMQRYAASELDREAGRLVALEERMWMDVIDRLEATGKNGGFRPLAMMRDTFGLKRRPPPDTAWDIAEDKPWRRTPTHFELSGCALIHAKRLSGAGHADIEMVFAGHGEQKPRTFTAQQFITDKIYAGEVPADIPGRRVMGWQLAEMGDSAVVDATKNVRGLEEWIRVLGLDKPPTLDGILLDTENVMLLSDETKLHITVKPNGATRSGSRYEMAGIRVTRGSGVLKARAEMDVTYADGTVGVWEVARSRHHQSVLHVRDPRTGARYFMMVNQRGELQLWSRRRRESEFLRMVAAPDQAKDIKMNGDNYAPKIGAKGAKVEALSPTLRTPVMDDASPYDYDYLRVFGRQDGVTERGTSEHADHDTPRVRFSAGTDLSDKLVFAGGSPTNDELAVNANFPFGKAGEYSIDYSEEEWIDAMTGEVRRGKVRVYFYRQEQIKILPKGSKGVRDKKRFVRTEDEMVETMPYAWLEFDNRAALLGKGSDFRVARAHFHEVKLTPELLAEPLKRYNAMPTDADFLLVGGVGFLIGKIEPTDLTRLQLDAFLDAALRQAESARDQEAQQMILSVYEGLAQDLVTTADGYAHIARMAGLITVLGGRLNGTEVAGASPAALPALPDLFDAKGTPIPRQLAALIRIAKSAQSDYREYVDLLK